MSRRPAFTLVLCSTLALLASASASRAADPAPALPPVPTPLTDTGRPPPMPIDVVVCPAQCIECGNPGIICCLPNHQCIVLWMPIWFSAPGDASAGSGVIAPMRACPADRPPGTGGA